MNDVSLSSENNGSPVDIEVMFGRKTENKDLKKKVLKSLGQALHEAGIETNKDTRITLSE